MIVVYSFNDAGAPLSKIFIRGCHESHGEELEDYPEAETLKYVGARWGIFLFKVVNGEDKLLYHIHGRCGDNMHDTVGVLQTFEWSDGDWSVSCI